ncbi:MAG: DUF4143 domain-containing protein [Planctomycetaceae bacterium]|nr:DUF4143 domain-containing protein [Planctomycetaceae bacterium]
MIGRDLEDRLRAAAGAFPVVTVTGPRQSGKSTLCRSVFPDRPLANLELPDVRRFALEDPRAFLAQFPRGAVLDEVQRAPELASYLQPMVDADRTPGRWILTGSQNFALLESVNQSLAGRAAVLHLLPCGYGELKRAACAPASLDQALFGGGYPAIHDRGIDPSEWLSAYVATYVERDVRTLTRVGDLLAFQRFVELCAGRVGQLLNLSALAADAGISQPTAKAWLSVLEASFLVFRLPAWSANLRKRLTKSPKLHFYDTGLVCWLLGLRSVQHLKSHPLRGAIFESWVVSEVAKFRQHRGERGGLYHFRTSDGNEVDLIIQDARGPVLVEVKASSTIAADNLGGLTRAADLLGAEASERRLLVYGGDESQTRSQAQVIPWRALHGRLDALA